MLKCGKDISEILALGSCAIQNNNQSIYKSILLSFGKFLSYWPKWRADPAQAVFYWLVS